MSLQLRVDSEKWRQHLRNQVASYPELIPVIKGNGYGFGLTNLARTAQQLGIARVAVGMPAEIEPVRAEFSGEIILLQPWQLGDEVITGVRYLVADPSSAPDKHAVEIQTSMRRFGLSGKIPIAAEYALHFPLSENFAEAEQIFSQLPAARVSVSHLKPAEIAQLAQQYPNLKLAARIGTELWLGCRESLQTTATVLAVHQVAAGEPYGYRRKVANKSGYLLVVSGGTAHGIGLETPTAELGLRSRAVSLAKGGLAAAGVLRSPYSFQGQPLRFAEPPHMQCSLLWAAKVAPNVGDELAVNLRFTTTNFDRVIW